ncbi:hypothetical protein ACFQ21_00085 [Ohtaekwangia kribbensis]|uniref:Uncharacterized protein n=1 Tax=Ohtaekwangia kribbensis TaxID=688913 RepID=A0ABW3JUS1_9BACT
MKARVDQNIVDFVLQELGSVEGLVAFARDNGISVDGNLDEVTDYKILASSIVRADIVAYYDNNELEVATGFVENTFDDRTWDDSFDDSFGD